MWEKTHQEKNVEKMNKRRGTSGPHCCLALQTDKDS